MHRGGGMKDVTIGIIGGTGGIGKWFARFFKSRGFVVHVSGRRTGMDMPTLAKTCSIVIVSVPIGATTEVIKRIGPHMRRNSLLMDLTSLKEAPVRAMRTYSRSEVIGCHPLFGPSIRSIKNQNIVLCPARGEIWLPRIRRIFEAAGARVVETTPRRHDDFMAVVQGLNHLNTIAMGLTLRKSGIDRKELAKFSTPAFLAKLKLIDRVSSQPGLYTEIMTGNPALPTLAHRHERAAAELRKIIQNKDSEKLLSLIAGSRNH